MALAFKALTELGFEVWIQKGCGLNNASLVHLGIVTKFPRRKSGNISPYFFGRNPATLHLRCIIAHKTLSLASFRGENTAMRVPYFHGKNLVEFRIWCAMVHQQGFASMYTVRIDMLAL